MQSNRIACVLLLVLLPIVLAGCSTGGVSPEDTWFEDGENVYDVHESRPPGWWKEYEKQPEAEAEAVTETHDETE